MHAGARLFPASIAVGLLGLTTAHCGGAVPITGKACPCVDGYVCCAANTCVEPGQACPADGKGGSGLVVGPASIVALCNAPHGPPLPAPRTAAGLTRLLARRWYVCGYDPKSWSPLLVEPGLEFRSNGDWAFISYEHDGSLVVPATVGGTYRVYNDLLATLVPTTDTTPGATLHVRWFNDKLDPFHEGKLDLKADFEHSPLRFRTEKAVPHWFVALDQTGIELNGVEGTACPANDAPCREGARCVYERNVTVCSKPATVQRGEGCDRQGTRTCAANLTCLEERRCGDP